MTALSTYSKFLLSALFLLSCYLASGQINFQQPLSIDPVGNNPDPSAILDLQSTDKGILIPRMTSTQRTAITGTEGLMVYDTVTDSFWYHDGSTWLEIGQGGAAFETVDGVVRSTGDHTEDFVFGQEGLPNSPPFSPTSIKLKSNEPNGALFFFDKSAAAFRSGEYNNSQNWNPDSLGRASFGSGLNTLAKGDYSAAFGKGTIASLHGSLSIGHFNTVDLGGQGIPADYALFSVGNGSNEENRSTAFGIAEDGSIHSTGSGISYHSPLINSHYHLPLSPFALFQIEGTDRYGQALGAMTTGIKSPLTISGPSVAGIASFSSGIDSEARGNASSALGHHSISNGYSGSVIGMFNDTMVPIQDSSTFETPLFIVGNGDDDSNRSNALVVRKDGRIHADGPSFIYGRHDMPKNGENVFGSFFFYDKDKRAFRGGEANSDDWSSDSLGMSSFAFGYRAKATGDYGATALGNVTSASGEDGATALGDQTVASGTFGATAIGRKSEASGDKGATALGNETVASGNEGATALGTQTEASGDEGAIAMGRKSVASGDYGATALGYYAVASGDEGAISLGNGTVATGNSCTVVGLYNDTIVSRGTAVSTDSPLFIVGNGDFGNRSNALIIRKSGKVEIPDSLIVEGYMQVGTGIHDRIYIGNDYIKDGGPSILRAGANFTPDGNNIYNLGGNSNRWKEVFAVEGMINTSDRRAKKNISNIKYGIDQIMSLRPVDYHWNKDDNSKSKSLGLIAQEILEVIPEVVHVPEDEEELMGINYAEIVPVLIKAIQEQQEQMNHMEEQLQKQNSEITDLKNLVTVKGNQTED